MQNNLPEKRNQQLASSIIGRVDLALIGKSIEQCNDDEILACLKYIVVLLGIPFEKLPQDEAKQALINFLRDWMQNAKLDELRLAFELAVSKKTGVDLTLYGNDFSAKFILDVFEAYKDYKFKLNTKPRFDENGEPTEVKMTNTQKSSAVFGLISKIPGAIDEFKKIGTDKQKPEPVKLPHYDVHQKWMKQFDKLKMDDRFVVPETAARFIKKYGLVYDQKEKAWFVETPTNIEGYVNYKADQLHLVKEYLKTRNIDIL